MNCLLAGTQFFQLNETQLQGGSELVTTCLWKDLHNSILLRPSYLSKDIPLIRAYYPCLVSENQMDSWVNKKSEIDEEVVKVRLFASGTNFC